MGMPLIVGSSSCMILKLMSCTRHWVDSVAMRFAGDDCLVHDVHGIENTVCFTVREQENETSSSPIYPNSQHGLHSVMVLT